MELINERCNTKWNKIEKKKSDIPIPTACALIYNINWSVRQYQELRLALINHSFNLPPRNNIDLFKMNILLKSIAVESTKTYCDLSEPILQTTGSFLENSNNNVENAILSLESKFGLDGSGSHARRHQLMQGDIEDCNNYIGAFWSPLILKMDNEVVWENPLPNSILYCRPVCLIREKENKESIFKHFKLIIDTAVNIERNGLLLEYAGSSIPLNINIEISMVDGKMVDILQGDSGSFCHYCYVSRQEANDLTCILQGFLITKHTRGSC